MEERYELPVPGVIPADECAVGAGAHTSSVQNPFGQFPTEAIGVHADEFSRVGSYLNVVEALERGAPEDTKKSGVFMVPQNRRELLTGTTEWCIERGNDIDSTIMFLP